MEARSSEQVAAAVRALQLIHGGSAAEIAAQLVPGHPMAEQLAGPQAAQIMEMARELLPAPSAFVPTVERVIVFGDEAIVVARDRQGGTSVSLRRENGVWKMAPGPIPHD